MSRADIAVWGPSGWNFIHAMSFAYPIFPSLSERTQMFTFLHSFAQVLPCFRCRVHFMKLLNTYLPTVSSEHLETRETLVRFLVDAHNMVNKRIGKKEMEFEQVMSLYGNPDMKKQIPQLNPIYKTSVTTIVGGILLTSVLITLIIVKTTCNQKEKKVEKQK
jgi:hypothetical protein